MSAPARGRAESATSKVPAPGRSRRIDSSAAARASAARATEPAGGRRPRDAAATRERILDAAVAEFAEHGYTGARIDAIAQRADANMRMLYHYFGSKKGLYVQVLERVFEVIRVQERRLNLRDLAPLPAMVKLFGFTYAHFAGNPLFIRLLTSENLLDARYLKTSSLVSAISSPLVDAMRDLLARGEAQGVFRSGVDPLQLYVTMVAMSYFHLSNAPTLSHLFGVNLRTARWRSERRQHATEMLLTYLRPSSADPVNQVVS